MKDGYLWVSEKPGWGIEIDEKAAAKAPFTAGRDNLNGGWGEVRRPTGRSSNNRRDGRMKTLRTLLICAAALVWALPLAVAQAIHGVHRHLHARSQQGHLRVPVRRGEREADLDRPGGRDA